MHAVKTVVADVQNPATEISPEEAAQYAPLAVEGDEVRIEIDTSKFGRIATQTAKDVYKRQDCEPSYRIRRANPPYVRAGTQRSGAPGLGIPI